jgi:hypothetical protein
MGANTELQLDSSHCQAICDEIGARLRVILDRETTAMPPRLQALLLRLAAQELSASPSMAPSLDDMTQNDRAKDMTGSVRAA